MDASIPTYHLNFLFFVILIYFLYGRAINLLIDTKMTALLEYLNLLRDACKAKLLQANELVTSLK